MYINFVCVYKLVYLIYKVCIHTYKKRHIYKFFICTYTNFVYVYRVSIHTHIKLYKNRKKPKGKNKKNKKKATKKPNGNKRKTEKKKNRAHVPPPRAPSPRAPHGGAGERRMASHVLAISPLMGMPYATNMCGETHASI